ncbi:MAG TPA: hypothetical protein VNZ45_06095 [Bacteroidia bacterium]|nr:hypothetical protein [Bacteroidia bacterium]
MGENTAVFTAYTLLATLVFYEPEIRISVASNATGTVEWRAPN